jgi:GNAT superfamily N-acetyltransferase
VVLRSVKIRKIQTEDEVRWRALWAAYGRFYHVELSEAVTRHTWTRIMDPASQVHAIVAEDDAGEVIGFCNYVIHENTFHLTPVCYLEDLFVEPEKRAAGVGKLLIDWLADEMKAQGWCRIYWHTQESNYRARGLYDKYGPHSGNVRYAISNPAAT